MKATLESLVVALFGQSSLQQTRWVPAYFPFTDPSWELEICRLEAGGETKWMEVLGCGVIHSQILRNCGRPRQEVGWAFGLGLERLAMALFEIPDIRLFWSEDPRFISQFGSDQIVKFKPYSRHPLCFKDVTFWLPQSAGFHVNDLHELLRHHGGDLVESVTRIDSFRSEKTQRESHCYRICYRSMDRNLTNEEINDLQERFRKDLVQKLHVELR